MMNHLLYMDDLKLYGRLENSIDVVRRLEGSFGLGKLTVLVLIQGIKVCCEGIVLPHGKMMSEVDENG